MEGKNTPMQPTAQQTNPSPAPGVPTDTTVTPPSVEVPKKKLSVPKLSIPENIKNNPKLKRMLIAGMGIIVFLIILSVFAPFVGRMLRGVPILPTPSPSPTPLPTPPSISNPSPYVNDEEVLSIEKDIQDLDTRLREANFREDELRVPSLDWDVRFD